MAFEIDASAIGKKADDYADLSRFIPREAKKRLGWIAVELKRQTQQYVGEGLFRKPTGTLMRKLNASLVSDDTIILYGGTKYTRIQDIGGPINNGLPIVPVRAKALKFSIGGVTVFAKSVKPGTIKPKHFSREGWKRTEPYAKKVLTDIRDIIQKGKA